MSHVLEALVFVLAVLVGLVLLLGWLIMMEPGLVEYFRWGPLRRITARITARRRR
jgi:hypothetical protein